MQDVEFGRWRLEADPTATRAVYAMLAPTSWNNTSGRNFFQACDQGLVWPPSVAALLEKLGIDYHRDVEMYHIGPLDNDLHGYGGFFHFVGTIVSGKDASIPVAPDTFHYDLEQVSVTLALGFTAHIDLLETAFSGPPVVQLVFDARVPWVLSEPP